MADRPNPKPDRAARLAGLRELAEGPGPGEAGPAAPAPAAAAATVPFTVRIPVGLRARLVRLAAARSAGGARVVTAQAVAVPMLERGVDEAEAEGGAADG